jgi:hypothetical protein
MITKSRENGMKVKIYMYVEEEEEKQQEEKKKRGERRCMAV